jgi:myo-inositol-1(or 4)-monophosphatase
MADLNHLPSAAAAETLLRAAEEAARLAGDLLRQKLAQPRELSHKLLGDWVTDADHASQALITDFLRARFPGHAFIAEEVAPDLPRRGPITWLVDPVDGTSNYSRQQPNFSVSIAAAAALPGGRPPDGAYPPMRPLAGVIYDPMRDELFGAAAGQGATLNGRPIAVSPTAVLDQSIVGLDWSHYPWGRRQMAQALTRFVDDTHSVRAIGSAALALAWVACGRLDAYANLGLGPWDAAAADLLIREAGGRITDLDGRPWTINELPCLASNGLLHEPFRAYFAGLPAG